MVIGDESVDVSKSVWIFGYGSLTWKPNMSYTSSEIGYIRGFKRRFWQGSTTHRGTPENPGRVATMVEDDESILWGIAYEITGKDRIRDTLRDLNNRESILGGYATYCLPFHHCSKDVQPFDVIIYAATPRSAMYLGEASIEDMAQQIVSTSGHAGPNYEYITKLADFTRKCIPEDDDEHLFSLDRRVRDNLLEKQWIVDQPQDSVQTVSDNDIVDELVRAGLVNAKDVVVNPNDLVVSQTKLTIVVMT